MPSRPENLESSLITLARLESQLAQVHSRSSEVELKQMLLERKNTDMTCEIRVLRMGHPAAALLPRFGTIPCLETMLQDIEQVLEVRRLVRITAVP